MRNPGLPAVSLHTRPIAARIAGSSLPIRMGFSVYGWANALKTRPSCYVANRWIAGADTYPIPMDRRL